MADIGYIALFLALVASIYSAIAFIFGAREEHPALSQSAKNGLLAVFGLTSIAVLVLINALLTHNFRIEYVAAYTSRDLSVPYLLSALWAGNDGSLLFWGWLLSLFAMIVVLQKRDIGKPLVPYAAAVIMITEAFFLILMLFMANPFQELSFTPADGRGLNPLLENAGMMFHPPTLLAGYVGLTIPFAFAIAALLTRRFGDEWIISIRRWTLMAWLLLGIGNIIGAWWAYVELGWGGFWAWDPVENAGLMPWLVATAFLHSIMMQRRRGMLKIWNMVLVILSFSLAIFGTFLTRSGVLSSVHSFGESSLGPFFVGFIGITLIGSFGLLYYREEELKGEAEMESLVSRESTFLLNNLLFVGAAFAIFVGTIFPLVSEAVRGVKISVGAPFFDQVNGPIFLAIILLAGICTLISWRRASPGNLIRNLLLPVALALVVGIVLFIIGIRQWHALIAFIISSFVLATIFYEWVRGSIARHRMRGDNYVKAFLGLIGANRPRYGGYIVHISIVLMTIGVVGSTTFDTETEATLQPGDTLAIGRYTLEYENIDYFETESKEVVTGSLSVYNQGEFIGTLTPEKYFHRSYEQPVTEVAIRSTLSESLYVILLGWDGEGAATFKVLVHPLVNWIWIGGIIFVIGSLISFWPEGRRAPSSGRAERRKE